MELDLVWRKQASFLPLREMCKPHLLKMKAQNSVRYYRIIMYVFVDPNTMQIVLNL